MEKVDVAELLKKTKSLKKKITRETKKNVSTVLNIPVSKKLDYAFHHTDNLQLMLFYLDYCKKFMPHKITKYRMRLDLQDPNIIDSVIRHIEELLGLEEKRHYKWDRKIPEGYFYGRNANVVNFFKYYTMVENESIVLSKLGESQLNNVIAEIKGRLFYKSTNNG